MATARTSAPALDIERLLETRGGWLARARRWLSMLAALVLIGSVTYTVIRRDAGAVAPRYETEPARTGNLVVTVSATGNLQPTNQVVVGSELSGIVEEVYVEENDEVEAGQLLARLDLSKLRDAAARSRANLAAAEAQVAESRATVAEARAQLERFQRVSELSGGRVPSQSEMTAAEAALARGQAAEASARASVVQAQASIQSDLTNLEKAHIRSPIRGVVLVRSVEPGQTVAASFQAPVLFTIAEDLSKMELAVDVDEADVGQVAAGQRATFTVDAWPGRTYEALTTRIGYGSHVKEGVVSYPAVLEVDNADLSLRPGMTGTAEIITVTRESVLLIPNDALRFTPPEPRAGEGEAKGRGGVFDALMPRRPGHERTAMQMATPPPGTELRVWTLRDGAAVPVQVTVGVTDDRFTEITGDDLREGDRVITGVIAAEE